MAERRTLALASRSPRRAALLDVLGVEFRVVAGGVDEQVAAGEAPDAYVERIAHAKAGAGRRHALDSEVVLAADTTVALGSRVFGKPRDARDAADMLRALAGRWHEVFTAVVVDTGAVQISEVVATRVEFAPLDDALIAAYWATGEPADKAGAYGIQGLGGALVTRIEGSYTNVVGLPLCETRLLLAAAGVAQTLSSERARAGAPRGGSCD